MKRTKIITTLVALMAAFTLVMAGCNNDDDDEFKNTDSGDSSTIAGGEEPQLELETLAFNILRGLCALPTDNYDSGNAATNSEDPNKEDENDGIEELPVAWQYYNYELDQALVPDPNNSGEYYLAATCAADARDFFSSLIGEDISDNTYYWYNKDLGTLRFTLSPTASAEDTQLYATIDVSIFLIPALKTIKVVPPAVLPDASNKFSGNSFYKAGDIVFRKKDSSYWMCVRPSGGPARKDYSYWVCLNPGVKDKIVTTTKKSYTVNNVKHTGIFAKNLMSEKIAKATIHTLNLLALDWWTPCGSEPNTTCNGKEVYETLKAAGFDIRNLSIWYNTKEEKLNDGHPFENGEATSENKTGIGTFYVAFGGPKKETRSTQGTKATEVQPVMWGTVRRAGRSEILNEYLETKPENNNGARHLYHSLTDSYIPFFMKDWYPDNKVIEKTYDVTDYYQTYGEDKISWFDEADDGCTYLPTEANGKGGRHVIISPELKIKDNGNAAKGYELKTQTGTTPSDYWTSLTYTNRYENGKEVRQNKMYEE